MSQPSDFHPLSRRGFLKLAGLGLSSALLPKHLKLLQAAAPQQARVLDVSTNVYDRPSLAGQAVRMHWKDAVLPVLGVTIGDGNPTHNRFWYQIGVKEFVHASGIQPVQTILNAPVQDIPQGGTLAEVTVPFTDAYWEPNANSEVAYRHYYGTTCWVINTWRAADNVIWYEILEDKWEFVLYIQASHVRLVPPEELGRLSPNVPTSAKRLELRREEQLLVAFEYDRPVFMSRVSSGAKLSDGDYTTPFGHYLTFHKRPSRHMARGNLAANGYDLPGVPWVTYFTEEGMAIHGTYWHNDYGKPRSHGCINLPSQAARWVFRWTDPSVPAHEQKVHEQFGTVLDVV